MPSKVWPPKIKTRFSERPIRSLMLMDDPEMELKNTRQELLKIPQNGRVFHVVMKRSGAYAAPDLTGYADPNAIDPEYVE
jgi:hypothetical protein